MLHFRQSASALLWFSCAFFAGSSWAQKAWVVGQSVPLSGSNASFGRSIQEGSSAYFKTVNARGGVAGSQIELVSLDDQNERKIAGTNTEKLLETSGAVALFGYASATLSLDAMPQAEKAGVLFFAPFSGANPVRKASPVVFTLRASYGDELEKMLAFWTSLGFKQVVVVHYDDEVGTQNLAVVTEYLAKQGKKPSAFSLKRNAKLDPAQVTEFLKLEPDVIINTVLSGPAAEMTKQIAARGMFVPTSSLSFVGAQQFIQAVGEAGAGVSIAQVVPNPNSTLPVVRECAKALKDSGVTQDMNSTHLEACIGAKVLTEAMRRSKKTGDAAALLAALSAMGSYDTGGFTVAYGPKQHHGSKYVQLGMVTRSGKMQN